MSMFIVDDHISHPDVLDRIRAWATAQSLFELRPNEHILDDRVPSILRELNRPTFITIDKDFWDRDLVHPDYGILYFDLPDMEQHFIPPMLRALLRMSDFRTRAARMGKVARAQPTGIEIWEYRVAKKRHLRW